jgi:hypothetical protein
MPKIAYKYPGWLQEWMASEDPSLEDLPVATARKVWKIIKAIEIVEEYEKQGYQLTLRQLYYQFVARDLIPNKDSEYHNLGKAVNDGRLWGLIDWDHLVDRARNFEHRSHWEGPDNIIEACANSYGIVGSAYHKRREQEDDEKGLLQETSDRWEDVTEFLR